MILKEACIESLEQGMLAERNGAHRLEVCDHLEVGGTTPSTELVLALKERTRLPLVILIRPRGGDFVYTKAEFNVMLGQIEMFKTVGVYGIAIGILTEDGEIDLNRMQQIMKASDGLEVTFHMAFDELSDMVAAMEQLIELKVKRILTKGGKVSAIQGMDTIERLVRAAGSRIIILPGGGVTRDNYFTLVAKTQVAEVHGTKIV